MHIVDSMPTHQNSSVSREEYALHSSSVAPCTGKTPTIMPQTAHEQASAKILFGLRDHVTFILLITALSKAL
jgi:hypothetical protein